MRRQRSHAPQATPPLATSTGVVTEQEAYAPHAWAAMGQGRVDPAPPCPYKYCPEREKQGKEGKKGRNRERVIDNFLKEEREGDRERDKRIFRERKVGGGAKKKERE